MRATAQLMDEPLAPARGAVRRLMTREMGKPITEAEAEVEKCASALRPLRRARRALPRREPVATEPRESYVAYEPLGVVLAIMPWNFPFWQVFRFAAPALMAGNGAVLKHASNVPGCALAIEERLPRRRLAGGSFPHAADRRRRAEPLIADPRIAAVTLTGRARSAPRIASLAAGARSRRRSSSSAGPTRSSSSPTPTSSTPRGRGRRATRTTARAASPPSGSSSRSRSPTSSSSRLADAVARAARRRPVRPRDAKSARWPAPTCATTLAQPGRARRVAAGAAPLLGGGARPDGLLLRADAARRRDRGMPAFDEETFGPVAAVRPRARRRRSRRARERHRATAWAPRLDARPGRGANEIARRIEAGCVFVNGIVESDRACPSAASSAPATAASSAHGIREFTNVKTVRIGPAEAPNSLTLPLPWRA